MKICHVNLASGYHGGENQTLVLMKQQLAMGYDLTLVANPKSPLVDAARLLNCRVVLAKSFLHAHQITVTANCLCVHVHEGRAIYWALLQKILHKIPYLVTRRIDNPLKKKWLSKLAYENAEMVIGLSTEIVRRIQATYPHCITHKIPSSPVSYPVDEEQVKAIKAQFGHRFLVIQAANMLKHKGFDVSIAAARLLQHHRDILFVLLGDGQERRELTVAAQNLNNVVFMGKQQQMGTWFKAANMLIHPAYSEGLGSVILEALDSGLPVIASNTGGIPDIIEQGISGLLIKPGDAQGLANAIVSMRQDTELRTRLITGGKKKLQDFDIHNTAARYAQLYQQISSARHRLIERQNP
jgi:glycosyltransferase involved in cell wall biosynthesis